MADTVECLSKYFGLNPTVNIIIVEFNEFSQIFDMTIFKCDHQSYSSSVDILEGFKIIKLFQLRENHCLN